MAVQKLGEVPVGTIVKLNESGSPVNYIVIHQGSPGSAYQGFDNVTLLLRQGIHSDRTWNSGDDNRYGQSDIHAWLNGSYLNLLDEEIRGMVQEVKIPYCPNIKSSSVSSGANGLSTKAFLPSTKEVNLNAGDAALGVTLSYFSGANNAKRVAQLNGSADDWWTRTPEGYLAGVDNHYIYGVSYISSSGGSGHRSCCESMGIRPALPLSANLFVLSDGTVTVDLPPTAPGSIDVAGVVRGETATITLTAATDPDGTVASYIYERSVDGAAFQQFAKVNSLTGTDSISEDWGTVAYRACAVDDLGVSGPYVTSETYTITSGLVTIAGPAADLGEKPMPFAFWFSCGVSDQTAVQDIAVRVTVDGKDFFTGILDSGVNKGLYIDTRFRSAGQHTIAVTASKEDYQPAAASYTFTVPSVTLPYEGRAEMPQNAAGQPVWWYGLARFIFGEDGKDLPTLLKELQAASPRMVTGSYQGTGQSGSSNPNKIVCGFRPKMAVVIAGTAAGLGESTGILWVGSDTVGSKHITVDDTSFAWYSETSADNQLNTSGSTYYYLIAG